MLTVNIAVFGDLADGVEPYPGDGFQIVFHRLDPRLTTLPHLPAPAWVFIPWALPLLSGLEVCRRIRCNPNTAEVRITLALEETTDRMRRIAAQAGASDYMSGPITRTAIVEAILAHQARCAETIERSALEFGDLTINMAAFQAAWKGRPLQLMPLQLRLLHFLMEHPGQVFTRGQLIEALGDLETRHDERTVDVWIGRLRLAFKAVGAGNFLRTVRSRGYMLCHSR